MANTKKTKTMEELAVDKEATVQPEGPKQNDNDISTAAVAEEVKLPSGNILRNS